MSQKSQKWFNISIFSIIIGGVVMMIGYIISQAWQEDIAFRGRCIFLLGLCVTIIAGLYLIWYSSKVNEIEAPKKKQREEEERQRRAHQFAQTFMLQYELSKNNSYTPNVSTPSLDTERLRSDLMDYYGTAAVGPFPMAQADLIHVQNASDSELISEAMKNGFDMSKYS